jgi:hypothetical protein
LGCYDTIPASDPKVFTAGLVDMLAMYPPAVIARAADPARGLPALVKFPNLASFREQLERMHDEYDRDVRKERRRLERENQNRLSAGPQLDDEAKARVIEGFRQLKAKLGG